jgi:hypothetical protein
MPDSRTAYDNAMMLLAKHGSQALRVARAAETEASDKGDSPAAEMWRQVRKEIARHRLARYQWNARIASGNKRK